MNSLLLYLLFAKHALFTFGGGYAMIPLFQYEFVTRLAILTSEEYANLVALAQITPGPLGLNAATYIGHTQQGIRGAMAGTLGLMTPSLVLGLAMAFFFYRVRNSRMLGFVLKTVRPAVIGIIASAVFFFADTSVFRAPLRGLWEGTGTGVCWQGALIFALSLGIYLKWRINTIWLLALAGLLGWILAGVPVGS